MEEDKPEKKVSEMNRTDTDTQHYCNLCNKMYKTLGILKNHKAKVHEGVNYPCDRCDYKATRKSNLIRHTQQVTFSKKNHENRCKSLFLQNLLIFQKNPFQTDRKNIHLIYHRLCCNS